MAYYHCPLARAIALCALLFGCAGTRAQQELPHSCSEIAEHDRTVNDGVYTVQLQGQPVALYCHDMAGQPREYLELPENNCSAYVSRREGALQRVQTCFQKVRIHPQILRVDIGDLTYSQTRRQGVVTHDDMVVEAMPYATAMACDGSGAPLGKASITLVGTGFEVVDTFLLGGLHAGGAVHKDDSGQQLELEGGGYCGWITPGDLYSPFFAQGWNPLEHRDGFLLQLRRSTDAAGSTTSTPP